MDTFGEAIRSDRQKRLTLTDIVYIDPLYYGQGLVGIHQP